MMVVIRKHKGNKSRVTVTLPSGSVSVVYDCPPDVLREKREEIKKEILSNVDDVHAPKKLLRTVIVDSIDNVIKKKKKSSIDIKEFITKIVSLIGHLKKNDKNLGYKLMAIGDAIATLYSFTGLRGKLSMKDLERMYASIGVDKYIIGESYIYSSEDIFMYLVYDAKEDNFYFETIKE